MTLPPCPGRTRVAAPESAIGTNAQTTSRAFLPGGSRRFTRPGPGRRSPFGLRPRGSVSRGRGGCAGPSGGKDQDRDAVPLARAGLNGRHARPGQGVGMIDTP